MTIVVEDPLRTGMIQTSEALTVTPELPGDDGHGAPSQDRFTCQTAKAISRASGHGLFRHSEASGPQAFAVRQQGHRQERPCRPPQQPTPCSRHPGHAPRSRGRTEQTVNELT